jgi:hypothetical protein
MSEHETLPAGSIDARVDSILREMVAGEGSPDLRPRVLAALGRGRHRVWWGSRASPWPWLALAGSVVVGLILLIGHRDEPHPSPQALRSKAGTVPVPTRDSRVTTAPAASMVAATPPRAAALAGRAMNQGPLPDVPPEDSLPPLEIPPIGGASPLVLPTIRTSSIDASELTFPALEIDPLPAEPPLSGSF